MKNKIIGVGKRLYETRFSFGATAAIITNLSLIVGLRTGEHAKLSIIASMLVIALADNISDSMGIHIYQESECLDPREVWSSTMSNFLSRLLVSLTFMFLVLFLPINVAAVISIAWGLLLLSAMSYMIAKDRNMTPYKIIIEHLAIAIAVIIMSNFAGQFILSRVKF
ncbi:MAG: hypothetical protein NTY47_00510 [Candidatus Omnitrophica bacterium]|nr:hypothetical protein [Candidatus Omnitrophota bacterium]